MKRAFVFPGQGSQSVGMGKELADAFPEARRVFDEVDDALSEKLSTLIFEGPEEKLNLTENTQPALMAVSMAVTAALAENGVNLKDHCAFVAGHSLGEYSALTAAGALTLTDAARLLRLRGRAMQDAVPVGKGAMAAILGLEFEAVKEIAALVSDKGVCTAANDNSTGQVVISGERAAVEAALALAAERGGRRSLLLPVSIPAHSPLMKPAAEKMAVALADAKISPPAVPVVANVTARAVTSPDDIRRLLVEQVTGVVRWRESVLWLKEQGITEMAELGAGKVLTGLVKRIDKDIAGLSLNTPDDIRAFVARLHKAPEEPAPARNNTRLGNGM